MNPYEAPREDHYPTVPHDRPRSKYDTISSWALLIVALNLCWVLMLYVGIRYESKEWIPLETEPKPLPTRVVDALGIFHVVLSGLAFLATFPMTWSWGKRLFAWFLILFLLAWSALCWLAGGMGTMGHYL
ncbi:hypothetical protein [Tautonia marina]|uniref:hypothetical protein n=1 Tax=Tautonia marina TaxID=2653855 RepID=UPI0012610598|nr:hypothetical protein [Tautonia marina]